MTYRLWWTVGYTCTSEREFLAAKHRLLPATYEMLDDALRRASQVGRAGGVAWLIEGDDKTRLERGLIEKTLKKRGQELEATTPATDRPTDRRGPDPRRDDPHRDGPHRDAPRRDGPRDDRGKMTR
jgi:hypothetical protein